MENESLCYGRPSDETSVQFGDIHEYLLPLPAETSWLEDDSFRENLSSWLQLDQLTADNNRDCVCEERDSFPENVLQDANGREVEAADMHPGSVEMTSQPNSLVKGHDFYLCSGPSTSFTPLKNNFQFEEASGLRNQSHSVNSTCDGSRDTSYQPNPGMICHKVNTQNISSKGNNSKTCTTHRYFLLKTPEGNFILKGSLMKNNSSSKNHIIRDPHHSVLGSNTPLPLDYTVASNGTQKSATALDSLMTCINCPQIEKSLSKCDKLDCKYAEFTSVKSQPNTKFDESIKPITLDSSLSTKFVDIALGNERQQNATKCYKLQSTRTLKCPLFKFKLCGNIVDQGRSEQVAAGASTSFNEATYNSSEEDPEFESPTTERRSLSSAGISYNTRQNSRLLRNSVAVSDPAVAPSHDGPDGFVGDRKTLKSDAATSLKNKSDSNHHEEQFKVYSRSHYLRRRDYRLQLEAELEELEKKNRSLQVIHQNFLSMRHKCYQLFQECKLQCDHPKISTNHHWK
ncbi:uncharacterized protein LOC135200231 [Macrobrachium nipponense]|uniref:uncharacterized protein LOC135200231 n=1 Tax=Macrobrachium nipponense TaxID=159736 RepID=UPI0030C7FDED